MTEIEEAHVALTALMIERGSPDFRQRLRELTAPPNACIPIDTTEPIDMGTDLVRLSRDEYDALMLGTERYAKLREHLTRIIVSTVPLAHGYHRIVDAIVINRDLPPPDLDSVDRAVDRMKV